MTQRNDHDRCSYPSFKQTLAQRLAPLAADPGSAFSAAGAGGAAEHSGFG